MVWQPGGWADGRAKGRSTECWKALWVGREKQLRIEQLGAEGRSFDESYIFNKVASTWNRQLRSMGPSPSSSTFWPGLQVLLQDKPCETEVGSAQSRWAKSYRLWYPGVQSSSIPSPKPVVSAFPQQTHCDFSHLVTHLPPLLPSPFAMW